MPARLTAALLAALSTLALGASPASAAKTTTIKATILGNPYVVSDGTSGLPVLIKRKSAKRARLNSPLGVLRVPRLRAVPTPDGKLLPGNLRIGDRVKTRIKVTRAVRRAVYAQMRGKRLSVYKRSPELSVRELEELLARTRAELAALSARMDTFEGWVIGRFGEVDAALGALDGRLDLLGDGVGDLAARTAALEADLAALRTDLQAQIDALAGELDGVEAQLQDLLARVTAAETAIEGLVGQVGEIESALGDLTTSLGDVGGQIASLEDAIATLSGLDPAEITDLTTQLTDLQSDLVSVTDRLTTAEALLTTTVTQLGDVAADVTSLCGVPLVPLGTCS